MDYLFRWTGLSFPTAIDEGFDDDVDDDNVVEATAQEEARTDKKPDGSALYTVCYLAICYNVIVTPFSRIVTSFFISTSFLVPTTSFSERTTVIHCFHHRNSMALTRDPMAVLNNNVQLISTIHYSQLRLVYIAGTSSPNQALSLLYIARTCPRCILSFHAVNVSN